MLEDLLHLLRAGPGALALLPEMLLLAGAITSLLTGSFVPRHRQGVSRIIALATLAASSATAVAAMGGSDRLIYDGTYAVDTTTTAARLIVAASSFLIIVMGTDEAKGTERESEQYVLILLGSLGAVVLAGASDLLILSVGFLLASVPLYALIGIKRSPRSAEAALKTYLMGALLGIALLLGVTILYGLGGATAYEGLAQGLVGMPAPAVAVGLVGILAGLLFKAGAVPGHYWVPDAAQGANIYGATFATTVPKIGGLLAAYRLLEAIPESVNWPLLVAVLAAVTMTWGNLAAFTQTDPRRLLGWSTVSQAGYLLMPIAVAGGTPLALPALVVYLAGYAVSNITAFTVIAAYPDRRELAAYRGLSAARPWHAAALVVALLSLVGTPPTAVFIGKLAVFTAAWDGGFWWLTVVAAANSVASLFYYLRWLIPTFRAATPETPGAGAFKPRPWASAALLVGAGLILGVGLMAGLLWPPMFAGMSALG